MSVTQKTAIILGATGLTGSILLNALLADAVFSKIIVFGRSSVNKKHPKLEEHIIDVLQLHKVSEKMKADVLFCCIGTTKAKTPDKEHYKNIDYGIPVKAAEIAKQNGIDRFIVISAMGADPASSVFYNKTKGEMERDVIAQQIKNTYILQPSLIGGKRNEKRLGERFAQLVMGLFRFLIPKKHKMIAPEAIAKAMKTLSIKEYSAIKITSDNIQEIANS